MNERGTCCSRRHRNRKMRHTPHPGAIFILTLFATAVLFSRAVSWAKEPVNTLQTAPSSAAPEVITATAKTGVLPPVDGVFPEPQENDWSLILVNPWNSLPEDYTLTLTQLKNGHRVDERCYPALQEMMDDCRSAGLSPLICSSYRTWETQERLFQNKTAHLEAEGYSVEEAEREAGTIVAPPGTSEHQLGLAVDIVDMNNQNLNKTQEDTAVQKWLMDNSWKYGFILRYPSEKSVLTGIVYEPWHYRYVGKEAAKEIYEQGICLEEYLEQHSLI